MTFVKLSGQPHWYKCDFEKMRLYNFKGEWREIDKNSEEWMYATLMELEDWHDLYVKVGYHPMCCYMK